MTTELKFIDLQFKAKLADLANIKAKAMPLIYAEFVKNTPIATGNARLSTQLNNGNIEANYPYADVLDAGRGFRDGQMRGSEQAPDGMSNPTKEFAKKLIPQLIQQISRRRI
jgi:hypothetical protein